MEHRQDSFNDTPILLPEEDRFGILPFAKTLAESIQNMKAPKGMAITIDGKWGSGKTSAINLILHCLRKDTPDLNVIDFKCWWFRGDEALTLAFLQELNAALSKEDNSETKALMLKIGKKVLRASSALGPLLSLAVGQPVSSAVTGSVDFIEKLFEEEESLEALFSQLTKTLEKQDARHLVVIDDIDRLTPDEALLMFRLIKSVGQLPNVIYLLAFDRELAEKIVTERYPSEGPHFLEKIVQAFFSLPLPARDDLNDAVFSVIQRHFRLPVNPDDGLRFKNVCYDAICPFMLTPRHLVLLNNLLAVTGPTISAQVDAADFGALCAIRLSEPKLYSKIRSSKELVCDIRSRHDTDEDPEERLDGLVSCVEAKNRERAKRALLRLFPRLETTGYSEDFIGHWASQRRLCSGKHFDTYFRMAVGDETLPADDINEFIEGCHETEYVEQRFRKALQTIRKSGKSQVPLLLDELNDNASKIDDSCIRPLIAAIFAIADDIYLPEDAERGVFSVGDSHLRIHWLIRKLTLHRLSLDDRTTIFLDACKSAQVGWLVDFVCSATSQHSQRKGRTPEPEELCLVSKDAIAPLKQMALKTIRDASQSDQFIHHPRLLSMLFRWGEFSEKGSAEVKAWTQQRLADDKAVAAMAKAFTQKSWSHQLGMFGLGDSVSTCTPRASVEGLETILDIEEFRTRLKDIEEQRSLDESQIQDIKTFRQAWEEQTQQDHDDPRK